MQLDYGKQTQSIRKIVDAFLAIKIRMQFLIMTNPKYPFSALYQSRRINYCQIKSTTDYDCH